jgi:hypothetical protein
MTIYAPVLDGSQKAFLSCYLDNLALVERLHRLLLDVIKDEFERLNILEINSVQALLLFNIGENEVTAGRAEVARLLPGLECQLQSEEAGGSWLHAPPAVRDRPSFGPGEADGKGPPCAGAFVRPLRPPFRGMEKRGLIDASGMDEINMSLKRMERFWTEQIRYIY